MLKLKLISTLIGSSYLSTLFIPIVFSYSLKSVVFATSTVIRDFKVVEALK